MRWSWRERRAWKTLRGPEGQIDPEAVDRLQSRLVERYRRVHRAQGGVTMFDSRRMRWLAFGSMVVLGAIACAMPTETDLVKGQRVSLTLAAEEGVPPREMAARAKEIARVLGAEPGIGDVSVNLQVERIDGGSPVVTATLDVWGDDLDAGRLERRLLELRPDLDGAEIVSEPLVARIRETFAQKVSREVLHIEVGGASEEEIRTQILTQLAAQGFDGQAEVSVTREGDQTTIGIELSDEGLETEEVIEIIGAQEGETIELPAGAPASGEAGTVEREIVRERGRN